MGKWTWHIRRTSIRLRVRTVSWKAGALLSEAKSCSPSSAVAARRMAATSSFGSSTQAHRLQSLFAPALPSIT
eukprot:scaffold7282_cov113-Isochrysis_galbana.AAC.1